MRDNIQRQILDALLVALRPLARALLRVGIGYREFAEISKTAFVDIATKDYGLRGRPTNISRVAVMTGLTRKEVRRIRNKTEAGDATFIARSTPMSELLHRWFTENDFVDRNGLPKVLPFDDGADISFTELVRRFGGDIPPGAMRTELKRIDAIAELDDGSLKALKRYTTGADVHEKFISNLIFAVYPAALALAHNTDKSNEGIAWVQRTAKSQYIRSDDMKRIRRVAGDRLAEFAESIDDLFAAYESLYKRDSIESPQKAVGVSVCFFEEDKTDADLIR
jgi:hypothetical protein